jgi:hypothetical protein
LGYQALEPTDRVNPRGQPDISYCVAAKSKQGTSESCENAKEAKKNLYANMQAHATPKAVLTRLQPLSVALDAISSATDQEL